MELALDSSPSGVGVGRGEPGGPAGDGVAGVCEVCRLGSVLGEGILKEGNCCFTGRVEEKLGSICRSVASRKKTSYAVG